MFTSILLITPLKLVSLFQRGRLPVCQHFIGLHDIRESQVCACVSICVCVCTHYLVSSCHVRVCESCSGSSPSSDSVYGFVQFWLQHLLTILHLVQEISSLLSNFFFVFLYCLFNPLIVETICLFIE